MKRIITVAIALAIFILSAYPVSAAEPRYTNAELISVTISIDTSGMADVYIRLNGNDFLYEASITVYIERKLGSTWTRVNIGTADNTWKYTTNSSTVAKAFSAQLNRTGTYRAVAIFDLTGETVETITKTATDTY